MKKKTSIEESMAFEFYRRNNIEKFVFFYKLLRNTIFLIPLYILYRIWMYLSSLKFFAIHLYEFYNNTVFICMKSVMTCLFSSLTIYTLCNKSTLFISTSIYSIHSSPFIHSDEISK